MKTQVEIDGRAVTLDLEREGEQWVAGGRRASVKQVEPGIYSVLLGDRSFEVRVEKTIEGVAVTVGTRRYAVEVIDPRRLPPKRGGGLREGRQRVAAPMPGKVVRVLVAEGDRVEAGQGLAVVEAMKMQNEMKAPKAGRVVSLAAREGATVCAGDVLAAIE